MRSRARTLMLVSAGTILGAILAGVYVVRFMDVEDCGTSFDVSCTKNFIRLPGIVFSWPIALVIVMTFGALLGAPLGFAISRWAEKATLRTRQLTLTVVTVMLLVLVGVAGGRYLV